MTEETEGYSLWVSVRVKMTHAIMLKWHLFIFLKSMVIFKLWSLYWKLREGLIYNRMACSHSWRSCHFYDKGSFKQYTWHQVSSSTSVCVPRWSVAAARYYGSSVACGRAKESDVESFEEIRKVTSLVTHRESTMSEVSDGRLGGCNLGRKQPPQWFVGKARSWCSFLQPPGFTDKVLFCHLYTAAALSQRKSIWNPSLLCLASIHLIYRNVLLYNPQRTDRNVCGHRLRLSW